MGLWPTRATFLVLFTKQAKVKKQPLFTSPLKELRNNTVPDDFQLYKILTWVFVFYTIPRYVENEDRPQNHLETTFNDL